jgi:hypothetical protein
MPDFFNQLSPYEKMGAGEVSLPEVLTGALDRVMLVPNKATEFSVENGILYIISEAKGTSRFEEAMTVAKEHTNIIEFFDPALLYRAINGRTSFRIEKKQVCLRGPAGFVHLIAATEH